MGRIALLILLWGNLQAFGQQTDVQEKAVSSVDSLALDKVWHSLLNAAVRHDQKAFQALSLPKVDCIVCWYNSHRPPKSYLIPARAFTKRYMDKVFHERILQLTKVEPYTSLQRSFLDYRPSHLHLSKEDVFVVYELYLQTWKSGKIAPHQEGGTDVFQFVKVQDKFNFYGHATIP